LWSWTDPCLKLAGTRKDTTEWISAYAEFSSASFRPWHVSATARYLKLESVVFHGVSHQVRKMFRNTSWRLYVSTRTVSAEYVQSSAREKKNCAIPGSPSTSFSSSYYVSHGPWPIINPWDLEAMIAGPNWQDCAEYPATILFLFFFFFLFCCWWCFLGRRMNGSQCVANISTDNQQEKKEIDHVEMHDMQC
jgi:hypothetical protein